MKKILCFSQKNYYQQEIINNNINNNQDIDREKEEYYLKQQQMRKTPINIPYEEQINKNINENYIPSEIKPIENQNKEDYNKYGNEIPRSYEEYQEAMNNLEKVNFKVDYVITHCCGTQLLPRIYDTQHSRTDELTQFLWHLEKDFGLQFKHWYFGHHHRDIEIDDKHTCLYNNIVEV